MRVFAVSDIHIDYTQNKQWLAELSFKDYVDDIIIMPGDISHKINRIHFGFEMLVRKFKHVFFTPGNHDLWVHPREKIHSIDKLELVLDIADDYGVRYRPGHFADLSVVPLYGWYDFSFGEPGDKLFSRWADFGAVRWPDEYDIHRFARFLFDKNLQYLGITNRQVISFSHFMPRRDILPSIIDAQRYFLMPVLGSEELEVQIRQLKPQVHIYGHSHINVRQERDGILYLNNAFGYPSETRATKRLIEISPV